MLIPITSAIQTPTKQIVSSTAVALLLLLFFMSSCGALPLRKIKGSLSDKLNTAAYHQQFTGILVVDLKTKDTLYSRNAQKYFTPASTVKLFTLYAALKNLDKHTPLLKYSDQQDTLYIFGTGNPAFLHPYFNDSTVLPFLNRYKNILLSTHHYIGEKYGPGWAWEDYPYYFSAEINSFPLYGNVLRVNPGTSRVVYPQSFEPNIQLTSGKATRAWGDNRFYLPAEIKDTLDIPFITSDSLTLRLLAEKVNARVRLSKENPVLPTQLYYGIETDTILKRMLFKSDNFLAEQTMLMVAATLSDTLSFPLARDHVLVHNLNHLKQPPRWVDGSGLSRYNLFSPESMVQVLTRLYDETDTTRLFSLMPRWTGNGTFEDEKEGFEDHFLMAKSGSMGNIYNLCGYLRTSSGKLLVFSFMNNHFKGPNDEVREQMFAILKAIHRAY
ncbi:MAG: D-alanyl-D-alanine carboxypeptidase [Bacteroidota bacterium]